MADKYMKAIARHERAKSAVDNLTREIGRSIESCPITLASNDYSLGNSARAELWDEKTGKTKTHLWMAFKHREPSDCGYGEMGLCEDGVLDSLSEGSAFECEHCYRAYELIIQRKEARRELGHARLAIRALGKIAIKELGND